MNEKAEPMAIALHESLVSSVISDVFTFAITAGLVLLADGRSSAWQVITIGMFLVFVFAKIGMNGKVKKFYSKHELLEWANTLPDENKGGET